MVLLLSVVNVAIVLVVTCWFQEGLDTAQPSFSPSLSDGRTGSSLHVLTQTDITMMGMTININGSTTNFMTRIINDAICISLFVWGAPTRTRT